MITKKRERHNLNAKIIYIHQSTLNSTLDKLPKGYTQISIYHVVISITTCVSFLKERACRIKKKVPDRKE